MTIVMTGLLTCLALIVAVGPQSIWLLRQGLRRDRIVLAFVVCLLGDILLVGLGTGGVGAALEHAPWLLEILRWAGVIYLIWFAYRSFRSARQHYRGLQRAGHDPAAHYPSGHYPSGHGPAEHGPAEHDPAERSAQSSQPGSLRQEDQAQEAQELAHVMTSQLDLSELQSAPSRGSREAGPAASARPAGPSAEPGPASWGAVAGAGAAVTLLNPHSWLDTLVVLGSMANSFGDQRWLFALGAVLASTLWFSALSFGGSALASLLDRPRTWVVIDSTVTVVMLGVAAMLALHGV